MNFVKLMLNTRKVQKDQQIKMTSCICINKNKKVKLESLNILCIGIKADNHYTLCSIFVRQEKNGNVVWHHDWQKFEISD